MKFDQEFSIASIQKRSWTWKSIETIFLTLAVLLLLQTFRASDLFFLQGPVPWPLLLPVFCSLFYGALYGIASLIVLLFFLLVSQPVSLLNDPVVQQYVAGSLSFTFLVSIFSSYWLTRIKHVEHLNQYLWEHLEDLSKEHYLVRLSHERLEQAYIVKPMSVRDVFNRIGMEIRANDGNITLGISETLMGIFSQYCSINNAALCLFNEKLHSVTPLTFLGKNFLIALEDPMIQQVLKEKSSNYVAVNRFGEHEQTNYVAVIPFLSKQKEILGFIVIKDMAFWFLTHDNLEVLSVFAAYFCLQWSQSQKVEPMLAAFPDCPVTFLNEFEILVHLKKSFGVKHVMACIVVPPGVQQENILYTLQRAKRTLDYQWLTSVKDHKALITLMPFTSLEGLAGYKVRMNELLKNDFGLGVNQNNIFFRSRPLSNEETEWQLEEFLQEIHRAIDH